MYAPLAALVIAGHMRPNPDGTILLAEWHIPLGLPWADPKNPTRIGFDDACALLKKRGLKPYVPPGRKRARATS